jgi:hypothetical protein
MFEKVDPRNRQSPVESSLDSKWHGILNWLRGCGSFYLEWRVNLFVKILLRINDEKGHCMIHIQSAHDFSPRRMTLEA